MRLVAAGIGLLEASCRGELGAELGAAVPESWPPEEFEGLDEVFLGQLLQGAAAPGWLGWYWVSEGTLVGMGGFKGPPLKRRAELGYHVLVPWRGRGLATEGAQGLCDWALGKGVHQVCAHVEPANAASIAVLERLGFRKLPGVYYEADAPRDAMWRYVLGRSEP